MKPQTTKHRYNSVKIDTTDQNVNIWEYDASCSAPKLKILNSLYLVKCLTISSSLMFSGRFPTHKWRVSRTILFMNSRSYLVKAVRSLMTLRTTVKRRIFLITFEIFTGKAEASRFHLRRIMGVHGSRDIKTSLIGHFSKLITSRFILNQ